MSDMISRAEAIKALVTLHAETGVKTAQAIRIIRELPAAEEQRGRWEKISPAGIYECSACGQPVMTTDIAAYKYCHGCGAYMGEETEDAEVHN